MVHLTPTAHPQVRSMEHAHPRILRPWGKCHPLLASVPPQSQLITRVNHGCKHPLGKEQELLGITLGQAHTSRKTTGFQGSSCGTTISRHPQAGLDSTSAIPRQGGSRAIPVPREILVPFTTTHSNYKSAQKNCFLKKLQNNSNKFKFLEPLQAFCPLCCFSC